MRKTPLEQAIANQTDRRLRYDERLREKGFKKTSLWVHPAILDDLRIIARASVASDGDTVRQLRLDLSNAVSLARLASDVGDK